MNIEIKKLIEKLKLLPHPEGGFYKEIYRANEKAEFLNFSEKRSVSTHIYFMLLEGNFSAFHKIKSDEMWHYYSGDSIIIHCISPVGEYFKKILGPNLDKEESFFHLIPAGHWFASESFGNNGFGLCGCTVAPGFEFQDFEMAKRDDLLSNFPQFKEIIIKMTRI